jgi:hypothetical protein
MGTRTGIIGRIGKFILTDNSFSGEGFQFIIAIIGTVASAEMGVIGTIFSQAPDNKGF